jgi:hypothetical protein
MDHLRNVFTLGGGGHQAGGRGSPPTPRRAPTDFDKQSWERSMTMGGGDDGSVPNVAGQFAQQGEGVRFDQQERGGDIFTLGREAATTAPPAEITQPTWGRPSEQQRDTLGTLRTGGIFTADAPSQPQGPPSTKTFSGLEAAIARWKTTDPAALGRELEWQQGVGGDRTKITQFQETAGGLQEF